MSQRTHWQLIANQVHGTLYPNLPALPTLPNPNPPYPILPYANLPYPTLPYPPGTPEKTP